MECPVDAFKEIEPALIAQGGRFGDDFDSDAIDLLEWGRWVLQFDACDAASFEFESSRPGFDDGTLELTPLTRIAGTECAL